MKIQLHPLSFIRFIIISLTVSFPHFSFAQFFQNCKYQFSCGENFPQIEYPFWGGEKSSECGAKGFLVTCAKKNLTINISGHIFRVLSINKSTFSLTVAPNWISTTNDCPLDYGDNPLGGSPFHPLEELQNVKLFSYCRDLPGDDDVKKYPFSCLSTSVGRVERIQHYLNKSGCERFIRIPAYGRVLDEFKRNNSHDVLGDLVYKGFSLGYQFNSTACTGCLVSQGLCWDGTNSTEHSCLCPDGSHDKSLCQGPQAGKNKPNYPTSTKIFIGVGASVGTALIAAILFFVYKRTQVLKTNSSSTLLSGDHASHSCSTLDPEKCIGNFGVHIFDYHELEEATNNFDPQRELGDGAFGTMYKGKLKDGRDVAVKRLNDNNFKRVEHFKNEVIILTRLQHENLVKLYGCTSSHSREFLLVYEYIENGTVADHLHGALANPGSLPWSIRMNIAVETASALCYLHTSEVIHRDVKTDNILLDNEFCVKVADFGLSRLFPNHLTHISTVPQGTPGYVDPEYHQSYQLTDRSDVFSFGVVLMELITSMRAVDITRQRDEINLWSLAINKIQSNSVHEIVDQSLGFETDDKVRLMVLNVAELAFRLLQERRDTRPSMQEVLDGLKDIQAKDGSSGGNASEQADEIELS